MNMVRIVGESGSPTDDYNRERLSSEIISADLTAQLEEPLTSQTATDLQTVEPTHNSNKKNIGLRGALLGVAIGTLATTGILNAAAPSEARAATLALIDTGGDTSAKYVNPNLSYNALDGSKNVTDTYGHGNQMLEVISEKLGTPALRAACQDDCDVMLVKAASTNGLPAEGLLAPAIRYAYTHGADVINMSVSYEQFSLPENNKAIAEAATAGTVVVISSGNGYSGNFQGTTDPLANALASENQQNALIVGAVDKNGKQDSGTNRGNWVDTSEDGSVIAGYHSDENGEKAVYSSGGTSTAAARASVTALGIKHRRPDLSPQAVEILMATKSTSLPGLNVLCRCKINTERVFGEGLGLKIPQVRPLSITYRNSGKGKIVTKNRACRTSCTIKYPGDSPVKVVARPDKGYKFERWKGVPVCRKKTKATCSFLPEDSPRRGVLRAVFTPR